MKFEDMLERIVRGFCASKPKSDTYIRYNEIYDSIEICSKNKDSCSILLVNMSQDYYKKITSGDDWELYREKGFPKIYVNLEQVLSFLRDGYYISRGKWKRKTVNKCIFVMDGKIYQKRINIKTKTFDIKEYKLTTEDILADDWYIFCLNDWGE